jgi:hypothetical protein
VGSVPFSFSAAMRVSEFATAVRRVALLVLSFVRRMGWENSKAAASGALMLGLGFPGGVRGLLSVLLWEVESGFWVGGDIVAQV